MGHVRIRVMTCGCIPPTYKVKSTQLIKYVRAKLQCVAYTLYTISIRKYRARGPPANTSREGGVSVYRVYTALDALPPGRDATDFDPRGARAGPCVLRS